MNNEDASAGPNRQSDRGAGEGGLSHRLTGVETRVAGLETRVAGVDARLARVEAKMEFVATREDIANVGRELATLIANKETSMQRWLLGITSAALASVVIALLRTFA
ncbi:MAG: hypothetical protein F4220_10305 [Gammaproteobacteria bacterium]|nr:hypothetical protein [Gammaproteobacteria bacterium]MYF50525.1 hypothetical protein [Gammaproteobacteria bacterium]MYH16255.1 hypothetical protein [Gammaproteobacteria bacterium]MYK82928.1 hypothetical protein [Gammaproteobacteria bacterium]